jgi:hypothetical protein
MKKLMVAVVAVVAGMLFVSNVFASAGDTVAGILRLFSGAIGAVSGGTGEETPKEKRDVVTKDSKRNYEKMASKIKLKFGDHVINVFVNEYFITLYDAKAEGKDAIISFLFKKSMTSKSEIAGAVVLGDWVFAGDDLTVLQSAVQRGVEPLKMVLREYFLRKIDIDPSLSIVNNLHMISLDGSPSEVAKKDIGHTDLVLNVDKEKASEYFQRTYAKTFKVAGLQENVLIGSVLMSAYDVSINNQPNGIIMLLYRQTKEGAFQPLCDPKWFTGVDDVFKQDLDKKMSVLRNILAFIEVDPSVPPIMSATVTATKPASAKEESALEILKKRYAKGEISKEDFDKMKEDLK